MYQWSSVNKNKNIDYCENYILFAEQYMLAQLIKKNNKKVAVLINDEQDGPLPEYAVDLDITLENSSNFIYHYGNNKKDFSLNGEYYKPEIETIRNYAEYSLNDVRGLEILNEIYNLKDDEGCFRKLDETLR